MTHVTLSELHSELEMLDAETFEVADHDPIDDMPAVSTTSTTSSCTSSSGCSCCAG